jgi:hypothetical protein
MVAASGMMTKSTLSSSSLREDRRKTDEFVDWQGFASKVASLAEVIEVTGNLMPCEVPISIGLSPTPLSRSRLN